MKLKFDENLGQRCCDLAIAAGHDVATVSEQKLSGAEDAQVIDVSHKEGRALITLDLDFSNPLVFKPSAYSGIAVLRLPRRPSHNDLIVAVQTLLKALTTEQLVGKLWSVERGRIRVYQEDQASP